LLQAALQNLDIEVEAENDGWGEEQKEDADIEMTY